MLLPITTTATTTTATRRMKPLQVRRQQQQCCSCWKITISLLLPTSLLLLFLLCNYVQAEQQQQGINNNNNNNNNQTRNSSTYLLQFEKTDKNDVVFSNVTILQQRQQLQVQQQRQQGRQLQEDTNVQIRTILAIRIQTSDSTSTVSSEDISKTLFGTISGKRRRQQQYQYQQQDNISLKEQIQLCSNGKIILQPLYNERLVYDMPGIISIILPYSIQASTSTHTDLVNEATYRLNELLLINVGSTSIVDNTIADHILYVIPPKISNQATFMASADILSSRSIYYNTWILSVSALLHEFGHNFGLYHSSTYDDVYGDISGSMGKSIPYNTDSTSTSTTGSDSTSASSLSLQHQQCYNAQNLWQLNWYTTTTVPSTTSTSTTSTSESTSFIDIPLRMEYNIAYDSIVSTNDNGITYNTISYDGSAILVQITSFVDSNKIKSYTSSSIDNSIKNDIVLLKINTNLYMLYNRAKLYNTGTRLLPDQLVIVYDNTTTTTTTSTSTVSTDSTTDSTSVTGNTMLLAGLDLIDVTDYYGYDVLIQVCDIISTPTTTTSSTTGSSTIDQNKDSMIISIGHISRQSACITTYPYINTDQLYNNNNDSTISSDIPIIETETDTPSTSVPVLVSVPTKIPTKKPKQRIVTTGTKIPIVYDDEEDEKDLYDHTDDKYTGTDNNIINPASSPTKQRFTKAPIFYNSGGSGSIDIDIDNIKPITGSTNNNNTNVSTNATTTTTTNSSESQSNNNVFGKLTRFGVIGIILALTILLLIIMLSYRRHEHMKRSKLCDYTTSSLLYSDLENNFNTNDDDDDDEEAGTLKEHTNNRCTMIKQQKKKQQRRERQRRTSDYNDNDDVLINQQQTLQQDNNGTIGRFRLPDQTSNSIGSSSGDVPVTATKAHAAASSSSITSKSIRNNKKHTKTKRITKKVASNKTKLYANDNTDESDIDIDINCNDDRKNVKGYSHNKQKSIKATMMMIPLVAKGGGATKKKNDNKLRCAKREDNEYDEDNECSTNEMTRVADNTTDDMNLNYNMIHRKGSTGKKYDKHTKNKKIGKDGQTIDSTAKSATAFSTTPLADDDTSSSRRKSHQFFNLTNRFGRQSSTSTSNSNILQKGSNSNRNNRSSTTTTATTTSSNPMSTSRLIVEDDDDDDNNNNHHHNKDIKLTKSNSGTISSKYNPFQFLTTVAEAGVATAVSGPEYQKSKHSKQEEQNYHHQHHHSSTSTLRYKNDIEIKSTGDALEVEGTTQMQRFVLPDESLSSSTKKILSSSRVKGPKAKRTNRDVVYDISNDHPPQLSDSTETTNNNKQPGTIQRNYSTDNENSKDSSDAPAAAVLAIKSSSDNRLLQFFQSRHQRLGGAPIVSTTTPVVSPRSLSSSSSTSAKTTKFGTTSSTKNKKSDVNVVADSKVDNTTMKNTESVEQPLQNQLQQQHRRLFLHKPRHESPTNRSNVEIDSQVSGGLHGEVLLNDVEDDNATQDQSLTYSLNTYETLTSLGFGGNVGGAQLPVSSAGKYSHDEKPHDKKLQIQPGERFNVSHGENNQRHNLAHGVATRNVDHDKEAGTYDDVEHRYETSIQETNLPHRRYGDGFNPMIIPAPTTGSSLELNGSDHTRSSVVSSSLINLQPFQSWLQSAASTTGSTTSSVASNTPMSWAQSLTSFDNWLIPMNVDTNDNANKHGSSYLTKQTSTSTTSSAMTDTTGTSMEHPRRGIVTREIEKYNNTRNVQPDSLVYQQRLLRTGISNDSEESVDKNNVRSSTATTNSESMSRSPNKKGVRFQYGEKNEVIGQHHNNKLQNSDLFQQSLNEYEPTNSKQYINNNNNNRYSYNSNTSKSRTSNYKKRRDSYNSNTNNNTSSEFVALHTISTHQDLVDGSIEILPVDGWSEI